LNSQISRREGTIFLVRLLPVGVEIEPIIEQLNPTAGHTKKQESPKAQEDSIA